ncbi:hypothetical protein D3C75_944990 [compost metagenome]
MHVPQIPRRKTCGVNPHRMHPVAAEHADAAPQETIGRTIPQPIAGINADRLDGPLYSFALGFILNLQYCLPCGGFQQNSEIWKLRLSGGSHEINPVLHPVNTVTDIPGHIMIELTQGGQGFFFERQIAVVAQGMAGKKNRHRLLLGKCNRREDSLV